MSATLFTCHRCGNEKPRTAIFFRPHPNRLDGFRLTCIPCTAATLQGWGTRLKFRARDMGVRYEYATAQWEALGHPDVTTRDELQRLTNRDRNLQKKYGISVRDYDRMSAEQGGVCWICQQPPSSRSHDYLCIDHDRDTGIVRRLLCHNCNVGIGFFEHRAAAAGAAIPYLRDFFNKLEAEGLVGDAAKNARGQAQAGSN